MLRKDYKKLQEGNPINRLMSKTMKDGFVAISACRHDWSDDKEENEIINDEKTNELLKKIRDAGYSYKRVDGGFIENQGTEQQTDVNEATFLIYAHKRGGEAADFSELKEFALELCNEYNQDSVLVCPPGENPVYLNKAGELDGEFSKDTIETDGLVDEGDGKYSKKEMPYYTQFEKDYGDETFYDKKHGKMSKVRNRFAYVMESKKDMTMVEKLREDWESSKKNRRRVPLSSMSDEEKLRYWDGATPEVLPYQNNSLGSHTFRKHGKDMTYSKVLRYIAQNGGSAKKFEVQKALGWADEGMTAHEARGQRSQMWAALGEAGLVRYNPKTRETELTDLGYEYLNRYGLMNESNANNEARLNEAIGGIGDFLSWVGYKVKEGFSDLLNLDVLGNVSIEASVKQCAEGITKRFLADLGYMNVYYDLDGFVKIDTGLSKDRKLKDYLKASAKDFIKMVDKRYTKDSMVVDITDKNSKVLSPQEYLDLVLDKVVENVKERLIKEDEKLHNKFNKDTRSKAEKLADKYGLNESTVEVFKNILREHGPEYIIECFNDETGEWEMFGGCTEAKAMKIDANPSSFLDEIANEHPEYVDAQVRPNPLA